MSKKAQQQRFNESTGVWENYDGDAGEWQVAPWTPEGLPNIPTAQQGQYGSAGWQGGTIKPGEDMGSGAKPITIGGQEYIQVKGDPKNLQTAGIQVYPTGEYGNIVLKKDADKFGASTSDSWEDKILPMLGMAAFAAPLAGALAPGLFGGEAGGLAGFGGGGGGALAEAGIGSGIEGLTLADLAGEGLFTGLTDSQLAGIAGGGFGTGSGAGGIFDLYNQTLGQAPPGASTLAQQAFSGLDAEDAAQGAAMSAAGAAGGGPGINSPLTTGGAAGAGSSNWLADLLGIDPKTLQTIGGLAGSALGAYGANQQTNALQEQADKQWNAGSWARDKNQASYAPGFDLMSQPGYGDAFQRAADISGRAWSAKAGNPAGSPTAQAGILSDVWQGSYLPALSNYRGGLLQAGGQGLNTSGQIGAQAAQSGGGVYDALGFGLSQLTQPQNDIDELLKKLGGSSGSYKLNLGGGLT